MHATHHVVHRRHIICHVIQAGGARQDRESMVRGIAAQKAHEIPEPVGDAKSQRAGQESDHPLEVRRMQYHMTDPLRYTFPALHVAPRSARDVAADFERQPVGRKESESVTAAGSAQLTGRENEMPSAGSDVRMQHLDIRLVRCGQRDHIDAVLIARAQANDIGLVVAMCCEVGHSVAMAGITKPPGSAVERALGAEIPDAVRDVSDLVHSCHAVFSPLQRFRSAARRLRTSRAQRRFDRRSGH